MSEAKYQDRQNSALGGKTLPRFILTGYFQFSVILDLLIKLKNNFKYTENSGVWEWPFVVENLSRFTFHL